MTRLASEEIRVNMIFCSAAAFLARQIANLKCDRDGSACVQVGDSPLSAI
jgi:hypothetical protein